MTKYTWFRGIDIDFKIAYGNIKRASSVIHTYSRGGKMQYLPDHDVLPSRRVLAIALAWILAAIVILSLAYLAWGPSDDKSQKTEVYAPYTNLSSEQTVWMCADLPGNIDQSKVSLIGSGNIKRDPSIKNGSKEACFWYTAPWVTQRNNVVLRLTDGNTVLARITITVKPVRLRPSRT